MAFGNPFAQFRNILAVQVVLTPAAVATITTAEQTFTVPGIPAATVPCMMSINKPTNTAGVGIVNVRNSAANQIGITYVNPTAGNVTPTAAETHNVLALF